MDLFSEFENNKETKGDTTEKKLARKTKVLDEEKPHQKSEIPAESEPMAVSAYLDRLNRSLKNAKARIVGEVTEFKMHQNGHFYFTLVDKMDESKIDCVIWRSNYRLFGVDMKDGIEIIVTATPNIWKPKGRLSFSVDTVELVGEGALKIAYEKLKASLASEGLFDESRKRELPEYPHKIGVITSRTGAVINDFLSNIGKCGFQILLADSRVEGADAIKDLLAAVKVMEKQDIDVLVVMRGGGSLESFQAFNNEVLVRALAKFPVPVVTGIGHDKDAPLVSFVSDKNVSTPTAVANLLSLGFSHARMDVRVSEQKICAHFERALRNKIFSLEEYDRVIERSVHKILAAFEVYVQFLRRAEDKIAERISRAKETIENSANRLIVRGASLVQDAKKNITSLEQMLNARSPERQLKLGWSIARTKTGKVIRSVKDVPTGAEFDIAVADGTITAERK